MFTALKGSVGVLSGFRVYFKGSGFRVYIGTVGALQGYYKGLGFRVYLQGHGTYG